MLPLKDLNRSSTTPHINRLLLITNIVIFLIYWLGAVGIFPNGTFVGFIENEFVMIPEQIVHGQRLYTIFTSMFMHATWLHLFGNMLFLYVFGDNVEDAFGHLTYLVFYLFSGAAAAYGQILSIGLVLPNSGTYADMIVGASGAISGVLGAYLVLYPKAKVLAIILYVLVPIPAILFLGAWFALQWLYTFFDLAAGVAYWAHISGFIFGMILALTIGLRRKKARDRRLRL